MEPFFFRDGWEFSRRDCGPHYERWVVKGLKIGPPPFFSKCEYCIEHRDSGVQFCFRAGDVLLKCNEEIFGRGPSSFWLPSYDSPLHPAGGFDAPYFGRISINGVEDPSLFWEDVDLGTVHEQIVCAAENLNLYGTPTCQIPQSHAQLAEEKGSIKRKIKRNRSEKYPLINYVATFYSDHNAAVRGYGYGVATCHFHLVVTYSGWYVTVRQLFCKRNGARREREMTLQCNFKQNIVYREIIERQSKHFNQRRFRDSRELRVLFYEATQLKIQERYMPEPNSFSVRDASREIAFSGGKSMKTLAAAMYISDDKMESLLSNCGERIKLVERETGTRIQIIPLFRHPCNPRLPGQVLSAFGLPENTPRKVYIHGSQSNSEYAISLLKNYGKHWSLFRKLSDEQDVS